SDLELRVQGHPLAAGEVVVVDDSTALRISRVIPPAGAEVS
ncbi:MAG: FliM/FliN family flagellar motor switch protein, partial [Acidobacteria bacterium]|nr:FliM/FliN family flagellar motor switch protein [Acidobacteriota bacterium]